MHKASTLIALTLIGVGTAARAEEATPVPPAPAPMVVAPAPAPAPPARRIELGVSFLGMGFGNFTTPSPPLTVNGDAELAYGVSVYAGYRLIAGLSLGIAPQVIYNVIYKANPTGVGIVPPAATEYDLMARIAYTLVLVDSVGVYGEVLPGYSKIAQPGANPATGLVLALGGGVSMGLTDRIVTSIGVGYQLGYQDLAAAGMKYENRTKYLRFALGVGFRF